MTTPMTNTAELLTDDTRPGHVKINIVIDGRKFSVTVRTMTGRQLKALAGIAVANQLFLDAPGHGDDTQVLDDVAFELKSGMKFYDVPVGNLGHQ